MSDNFRFEAVREYRQKDIHGVCADLVPFTMEYAAEFVRMRNEERNKYFFNQQQDLTVESQERWYEKYLQRNNDIFWAILDKKGKFIGTTRLYDIASDGSILEQGSFMIDERISGTAPYAIEANIMCLDFAFDVLKVNEIINRDRNDNKVMNNLSRKFGFKFVRNVEINGVPYNYSLCDRESYILVRGDIYALVKYWAER